MRQRWGQQFRISARVVLCAWLLLVGQRGPIASAAELSETQVKAAFLFNFIKFVEWPASSFPRPKTPLLVCVVGSDEVAAVFAETVADKEIGDRPILVRRSDGTALNGCHVVYVGAARKHQARAILEQIHGQPVLTVGDMEQFARAGGMINFVVREHRVRFVINPDAGARAGLRISSRLLSVATIVREQGEGD